MFFPLLYILKLITNLLDKNVVPPRWILKPTDQDAILGNPVAITCKADGFPIPSVQWKQSIGKLE